MREVMLTEVSELQVMQQMQLADCFMNLHGTMFPDETFEDGVKATLEWVFGAGPKPLVDEEDESND